MLKYPEHTFLIFFNMLLALEISLIIIFPFFLYPYQHLPLFSSPHIFRSSLLWKDPCVKYAPFTLPPNCSLVPIPAYPTPSPILLTAYPPILRTNSNILSVMPFFTTAKLAGCSKCMNEHCTICGLEL